MEDYTLEKEVKMLQQSLEMYQKTLREMYANNANESLINAVKEEISSTEKYLNSLTSTTKVAPFTNAELSIIDDDKMKNMAELYLENAKDNDEPKSIKVNQFKVRFPKEFGIEDYMIESYYQMNDNYITFSVFEIEGMYPVLPLKIKKMNEEFNFDIKILNADGSVYYVQRYIGCKLVSDNGIIPSSGSYNYTKDRIWSFDLTYEKIDYLVPIQKNKKNETTYKEDNCQGEEESC